MFATLIAARAEQIGPIFLPIAVTLFALRGLACGLGHGGGSLAWNIGHLHFGESGEAEVYMGIHVFLTGLRGLLAPLLGMWLLQKTGWVVWLIALVLSILSMLMYMAMAKAERRESVSSSPTS